MKNNYTLNTISIDTISGISAKLVSKLARSGLKNLQDLLFYLPIRYENYTKLCSINKALPGMTVTVQGKIINNKVNYGSKYVLTCYISDNSGIIAVKFFQLSKFTENQLSPGNWIIIYGKVRCSRFGIEIIHPNYCVFKKYSSMITFTKVLTPVYSKITGIHQITLRNIIKKALGLLEIIPIPELLPTDINTNLISLSNALKILHYPPCNVSLEDLSMRRHPAQIRLIFEELLANQLNLLAIKKEKKKYQALPCKFNNLLLNRFLTELALSLTNAQQRVLKEILQDIAKNIPMMRLLQGDVGSGKTLIAAIAALCAISNGYQVAMMVPTEILAEQHTQNFLNWFKSLDIKISCLAGKQKAKARQIQQQHIGKGLISMVIGTQAIFQKHVNFANLALVIIDEQHRFGVNQRLMLWNKGTKDGFCPHQLTMTATPIPRTLEMTLYADLDISVIDELPPGRIPVNTVVVPETRRSEVIQRVRQACLSKQRQAYWVCTLVKVSDALEVQAAEDTWQKLQNELPEIKVELIHGRMKNTQKQKLIQNLKLGVIQLLVSTTVIEVGVDVPNVSLMIIENSERLGLSQLHQLRGRIGRGTIKSHCILLYKPPLNRDAQLRLQVLRSSNNGFVIAQRDLEIRGPGELIGLHQTGNYKFRFASLLTDHHMLPKIKHLAYHIHHYKPDLAKALIKRWTSKSVNYAP